MRPPFPFPPPRPSAPKRPPWRVRRSAVTCAMHGQLFYRPSNLCRGACTCTYCDWHEVGNPSTRDISMRAHRFLKLLEPGPVGQSVHTGAHCYCRSCPTPGVCPCCLMVLCVACLQRTTLHNIVSELTVYALAFSVFLCVLHSLAWEARPTPSRRTWNPRAPMTPCSSSNRASSTETSDVPHRCP